MCFYTHTHNFNPTLVCTNDWLPFGTGHLILSYFCQEFHDFQKSQFEHVFLCFMTKQIDLVDTCQMPVRTHSFMHSKVKLTSIVQKRGKFTYGKEEVENKNGIFCKA